MILNLTRSECDLVEQLVDSFYHKYPHSNVLDLAKMGAVLSQSLPISIRSCLTKFKVRANFPAVVIRGLKNNDVIARSPVALAQHDNYRKPSRDEVVHIIMASVLGQVFTWKW